MADASRLIADPQVLKDLNISDVTLWRWDNDPKYKHIEFPKPVRLGKRKYRDEVELAAWRQKRLSEREAA